MSNPQNQQPMPGMARRRSGFNLLFVVIAVLVVVLIWSSATNTNRTQTIRFNEFTYLMGLEQRLESTTPYDPMYDDNGNPILWFNPESNRVAAVIQQGNTFFILLRVNSSGNWVMPNNEVVTSFFSNPSRNASRVMFYQNTFEITDLITRQVTESPQASRIQFEARPVGRHWLDIMLPILYIILILGVFFFIWRSLHSRGGISGMGKNRATVVLSCPTRFSDVAGIEEEKEEVQEIVQFLRTPQKFLALGARIPKGFLLVGQPGTGKTLLAKAIAGEAGVPFFSISGSDFSEMLVGVGPSRMRDLFEQAKANAPCIIFIDEIDSIARMRGVGISGAAEENEQTLNQLLVQMDGFTKSEGVIVLAATNRPDVLDQALLRPGRFDRQIVVQMPDVAGREKILNVHSKHKPIAADVDLKRVAQIISGFSGADIENLMNESAIIAAKKHRYKISMADITEGINKVLLGPQKRSRIITDEDKRITAYHEAGHAIIAKVLQPKHTVQEVSIIPRGMAAGYTLTNDKDDVTAHKSRNYLKTQLAVYLGGRAAEQIFIGDICTGATQDIKIATNLAERMVTEFGMSEKLGPLFYGRHDEALMRAYEDKRVSDNLQEQIDAEVKALIIDAQTQALEIMTKYKKQVETMVGVLLQRETIYAEDIDLIMAGKSKAEVEKQIEVRLEKAREAEKQEQTEHNLARLEVDLARIMETANNFKNANMIDDARIKKLESNFAVARKIVGDGGDLMYLPTLDNIDQYVTLVGKKEVKSNEETNTETN